MENNYLITGYWGEPHVTPENHRGFNAAIFGPGRFVLPVGEQFRAEYIGNNTVRLYNGKLLDNGALAGIPVGTYVDLLIPEAGQGMKRNDLIIFQYKKDASTLVESGDFVVVSGVESVDVASDPQLAQQDLLTDEATADQMALYRIPVDGAIIGAPVKLFETASAGAQMELLWQNASPTSMFNNQTVRLTQPVTDYSLFIVGFRPTYSTMETPERRIHAVLPYFTQHDMLGKVEKAHPGICYERYFRLYTNPNGMYFGSCNTTSQTSINEFAAGELNTHLIPCEIYGIKGGKAT